MEQMRETAFFAGQSVGPSAATALSSGPINPFFGQLQGQVPLLPPPSPVPPGLHALYTACRAIYPNQQNPLQVAAVLKYWLGGPDPLDYISMFANPGDPEKNIEPHWHYVSFGLSDLHGDGRVHEITSPDFPSGFGFELTFRLKRESDEASPPTWPAAVMQSLAKYVFQSENNLCPGDHVSWHCSLDNSDSRIQHMVMTEDPQLGTILTPFGSVTFIQIIGVCLEELQAAQQWNGPGLIDLMKSVEGVGGPWLVTDMRRGETIFEIDPEIREAVDDGIAAEGSNLSGVTAKCSWSDDDTNEKSGSGNSSESESQSTMVTKAMMPVLSLGHEDEDETNRGTLSPTQSMVCSRSSRHSSLSMTKDEAAAGAVSQSRMSTDCPPPSELIETKFLNSVHLKLNSEAGTLLPLALRGRLKHGRHFTFKTVQGDLAITLLTETVSGSHATVEQPYALHGPWLQILVPAGSVDTVLKQVLELQNLEEVQLPKSYRWPELKLCVTIEPEEVAEPLN